MGVSKKDTFKLSHRDVLVERGSSTEEREFQEEMVGTELSDWGECGSL